MSIEFDDGVYEDLLPVESVVWEQRDGKYVPLVDGEPVRYRLAESMGHDVYALGILANGERVLLFSNDLG